MDFPSPRARGGHRHRQHRARSPRCGPRSIRPRQTLEGKGAARTTTPRGGATRFLNLLLVEQPNGDFAHTMVRGVFFDVYQVELWADLSFADDTTLAGIAAGPQGGPLPPTPLIGLGDPPR